MAESRAYAVHLSEYDKGVSDGFDQGFNACYQHLSKMVKKLGKDYYKNFLWKVKSGQAGKTEGLGQGAENNQA